MNATLARRFYQSVSATFEHGVTLDQRTLRTPGGAVFTAPTAALAEAVAAEWASQGEDIIPASMPITQLAFAAIDWTPKSRVQLAEYVVAYADTDLCAHRAEAPVELVANQAAIWGPLLVWVQAAHGVTLPVVAGIIAAAPDPQTRERLSAYVASLDDFRLTALGQAAGLSGSAVIALAMLDGRLDGKGAFEAAALDNLWALKRWGEDAEARAKLDRQAQEFDNIARFVEAVA